MPSTPETPQRLALPLDGIDAAILVGGLGTRLRGVVDDVPKPLAPVLGRPFLFYQLDLLALRGARSVTLCCGYKAERVREVVGEEWLGMPVSYSVEDCPLGTGGAIALAREQFESERVLVLNGDSWLEPDWTALRLAADTDRGVFALVAVDDASRFGTVDLSVDGKIRGFREKQPGAGFINGGVYLLERTLLAELSEEAHSLERDVFPKWAERGLLSGVPGAEPFLDIGVPESYAAAADFLAALGITPHVMFPEEGAREGAQIKLGTCVVIVDADGRLLLERRSDCGWWGLPGGKLEAGETARQGAIREAREETGLEVQITSLLGVFSDPRRRTVRYPDNGDLRQLVDVGIRARVTGGQLRMSEESLELRWFFPGELPRDTVPPAVEVLRAVFRGDACGELR